MGSDKTPCRPQHRAPVVGRDRGGRRVRDRARARASAPVHEALAEPDHRGHEPATRGAVLHRQPRLRRRQGLPEGRPATTTRSPSTPRRPSPDALARAGELHDLLPAEATGPGSSSPETGQLDPNVNSDFDLVSLLPNRTGPLPGDRRHQIKVFGAKDFTIHHRGDRQPGRDLPVRLRRADERTSARTRSTAPIRSTSSSAGAASASPGRIPSMPTSAWACSSPRRAR